MSKNKLIFIIITVCVILSVVLLLHPAVRKKNAPIARYELHILSKFPMDMSKSIKFIKLPLHGKDYYIFVTQSHSQERVLDTYISVFCNNKEVQSCYLDPAANTHAHIFEDIELSRRDSFFTLQTFSTQHYQTTNNLLRTNFIFDCSQDTFYLYKYARVLGYGDSTGSDMIADTDVFYTRDTKHEIPLDAISVSLLDEFESRYQEQKKT